MTNDESEEAPPHPSAVISETLADANKSRAATKIGVTRAALYNVMRGISDVTPEMAVRLERSYGVSADKLIEMQGKHDIWEARQRLKNEGKEGKS